MRFLFAVLLFCGLSGVSSAEPQQTACAYLASLVSIDSGPLFLPSYPTAGEGPLRGTAYLYDDAAAAVALVGCGERERARHIGDAILAALDHDRAWHDGRLRNAYAAGSVRQFPVKLGGWWDKTQNRWLEDRYQVGSDSGNMAWAMLALLAIDQPGSDARYRDGAARIGNWVAGRADTRGAGGFTGGTLGWESGPTAMQWKSTEHNTDLAGAFALLGKATGQPVWTDRSESARKLVTAMWNEGRGCFDVGTTDDGVTPNHVLALDAQVWPLIAIPGLAAAHGDAVLATIDAKLRGGDGYTYSDAGGGLWTEGTAQAVLTMKLLGHPDGAAALGAAIAAQRAPQGGFFATAEASLPTGFADASNPGARRLYFRLPHLAAAAWAALAETGFNPFTASQSLP